VLVAYLNVDVGVTGPYFGGGATPSLASVVRTAATMVTNPNTGLPVSKGWSQQLPVLGSGSDFTAMLDHFGVAATV
jgi:N-acetylated-alpha-linked acidic dipeptidase